MVSRRLRWSAVLLLPAAALCLLFLLESAPELPSPSEVRESYSRSEAALLDRHHEVIHEIRVDRSARRLEWTPLDEISPALRAAIVHAEDRRFYGHRGVDWGALAGSALGAIRLSRPRGASTISMQLAARLDSDLRPRGARRSYLQKLDQILAARELERGWTKDEILEAYLNLVSYRGELQGVAAASQGLFGKHPHGLDALEACVLAALVRSPQADPSRVAERAVALASSMDVGADASGLRALAETVLSRPPQVRREVALAPHVALRLLSGIDPDSGPVRRVSTLDGSLQRMALDTLRRHVLEVRDRNVRDGAVLVADNETGEVLAYVGNVGEESSARYVDGAQAMRQAGSTLKPFIYGLAFESRVMTPASLLEDSPLEIPVAGGVYRPRNYDNLFHGLVTARVALSASLNVPAVRTLSLVGIDPAVALLRDAGLRDLRSAEHYGPSLALGSADVTLWDLTNAYRALAAGGVSSPLRLTFEEEGEPGRRILSEEAAYLVSNILSDRESRARTFRLENALSTPFWTAVKTGTSKDMRDNWCVGYSRFFTVGVWVGNFSGEPMYNVSGITGAAPVWVEIMNRLHRGLPAGGPDPPSGIVAQATRFTHSGVTRTEYYLRGTETAVQQRADTAAAPRIVYPTAGTIFAVDPDIPEERQMLFFEAHPRNGSLRFVLDGKEVGNAGSMVLWSPVGGRHTLALVEGADRIVDSVAFEVRGGTSP